VPKLIRFFICLTCSSLYADVQIKGHFKSFGDVYITGKGNIYITQKYIEGVKPEEYLKLSKAFNVTEIAVKNFLRILKNKQVPPESLDSTFRQIAKRHKELQKRLKQFNLLVDPEIQELRKKAEQAINNGDYEKADNLLDDAIEIQIFCIKNSQTQLNNCKISAAELKVAKGDIELIRINYKAASKYYKEAVQLMPNNNIEKSDYLEKWGKAAFKASLYNESRKALEICLEIREKLLPDDEYDIGYILNDLAVVYITQKKNYEEAEVMIKKSLNIFEKSLGEIPSIILSNLAGLYESQGKFEKAEIYYKQSLKMIEKNIHESNAIGFRLVGIKYKELAETLHRLGFMYMSQKKIKKRKFII